MDCIRAAKSLCVVTDCVLGVVLVNAQDKDAILWGGDHLELRVSSAGGELEFDCATGKFKGPLKPDRQGRFRIRGTFAAQHGGPVREDEMGDGVAVVYSGTIEKDVMTLTMKPESGEGEARQYQLTSGQRGNVRKCR